MSWAVEQRCDNAGEKLVLLMLANHTNSHTGRCDPSHKMLADECSMGVSTLRRHLEALEKSGLIEIIHRSTEGVNLPNQYMLKLRGVGPNWTEGPSKSEGGVPPIWATKQEYNQEGNQQKADGGEAPPQSPSLSLDLPEDSAAATKPASPPNAVAVPASTRKRTAKKSPDITFAQFIAQCENEGRDYLTSTDPVWNYAQQAGLTTEMILVAWSEFEDKYVGSTKVYANWNQVFQNAVRQNWLRLWFQNDRGQFELTSAGKQAVKVLSAKMQTAA